MKSTLFFLLLSAFFLEVYSQGFKEIKDTSHACSSMNLAYKNGEALGYYHEVEVMPKATISFPSIAQSLQEKITHSPESTGTITFQTLINCEGKAADYQFLACSPSDSNTCRQVLKFFQNEVTWQPGIQKSKAVDVLIRIEVQIEKEEIKVRRI
ncbi:hypothetical protein AAGF08_05255 [Algoriphagus sp. SE2]|uniref:hypothetical protein n=1 Tax=Algoriphagus sp. SE2 TaxID=3141536 RepID=UPI0031CDA10A